MQAKQISITRKGLNKYKLVINDASKVISTHHGTMDDILRRVSILLTTLDTTPDLDNVKDIPSR